MKLEKSGTKGYHFFYTGFFVGYFFLIYFLLYHPNGLSPFQLNIHFFSNVVGSLSKRFLTETAPYALLFYLTFYAHKKWLRITLIAGFLLLFSINFLGNFFFFFARINVPLYVLQGFEWNLFFSSFGTRETIALLTLFICLIGLGISLYQIHSSSKIPLSKRLVFSFLFFGLTLGGTSFPVVYSPHETVLSSDKLLKKQNKLSLLELPGYFSLVDEIQNEYFRSPPKKQELTAEEKREIDLLGIERRLTTESDFQPKKIVLIALESVNQGFISHYNSQIPGTTPFLDQLIKNYPHIDAFYPSGPYTLFGLVSMLCSHTSTLRLLNDGSYECLPSLLKEHGYLTEFIHGTSKYYGRGNPFLSKAGYETRTSQEELRVIYPDFENEKSELFSGWGFTDNYLFDEVIKRLEQKKDEKLFITVHTVDTHATYSENRCYRERTSDDPDNGLLFSVHCLDSVLQDFFEKLDSKGLFDDDLLVIVTSDHLYPNYSGIPGSYEGLGFTAQPGQIPLVFISKKPVFLAANRGSQIDISPTLLDLLDFDAPDYYLGKSLISNSDTVPMGQDRNFVYMMPNQQFLSFDLLRTSQQTPASRSIHGNFLMIPSNTPAEMSFQIEQLRSETKQEWSSNQALLKWYINQL